MLFAPDTEVALRSVVNLINTAANGTESLPGVAELHAFLDAEEFTGDQGRKRGRISQREATPEPAGFLVDGR